MSRNGGTFGKLRTISSSSTSGVWDLYDAHQLSSSDSWQPTPKVLSITNSNGTALDEGTNSTITVSTEGMVDGTTLYYSVATVSGTTLTSADFTTGDVTGSFTINSNSGSFVLQPTADGISESNVAKIEIRSGSVSGDILSETGNLTIGDASSTTFYWPTSGGSTSSTNYVADFGTYVEFKGTFTGSSNVSYDCMSAWQYMMDNVPSSPSKFEFYDSTFSSSTPKFTNSNSSHCSALASALRNGTTTSNQGGWYVWLGCVNTTRWNSFVNSYSGRTGGILNDSTSTSYARYIGIYPSTSGCRCASGTTRFILRPHIGNRNWGGYNTTCNSSSRTMWLRIYT